MNELQRATLAECIGTFTLVFIGAGAGALAALSGGGVVGVALAHGFALVVIIYAWGAISGAHVNPAVTFGLALGGKIDWVRALWYWGAQFLGAALAALLLYWLIQGEGQLGSTLGIFSDVSLTSTYNPAKTVVVEGVLTFFLVIAVYASAVAGRNGNAAALAIGLVLTMDILCGAKLTGASMNPARTFGPALVMGNLSYLWMYIVGPLAGGAAAGLLYNALFLTRDNPRRPA